MKTLIVIDMQNDFVTGPLGTPEARDIVPKIKNKIKKEYNQSANKVIFTQDCHHLCDWDNREKIEIKNVPMHCITGTPGWCIVDELFPFTDDIIAKNNFGYLNWKTFFIGPDFSSSYKRLPPTSIEIVGVCTDICVISNALILRAIFPETPIIVDASCCAGTTPEKHKAALEVMKSCCIEVINE